MSLFILKQFVGGIADGCRHAHPAPDQAPDGRLDSPDGRDAGGRCAHRLDSCPGGRRTRGGDGCRGHCCLSGHFSTCCTLDGCRLGGRRIDLGICCRHGVADGSGFFRRLDFTLLDKLGIESSLFCLRCLHGGQALVVGFFFRQSRRLDHPDPFLNGLFLDPGQGLLGRRRSGRAKETAHGPAGRLECLESLVDSNQTNHIPGDVHNLLFVGRQKFCGAGQTRHDVGQIGLYDGGQCGPGGQSDTAGLHL